MLLSELYMDVTIAVIFLYRNNLHDLQEPKYKNSYQRLGVFMGLAL